MRDRAGFFAGLSDVLTQMCAYYVVAGILIMSKRGWGLHLFWLLLCAAACAFVFAYVLKKPRGVPFLTGLTGGLILAVMGVFRLASSTPMRFGYGFVLCFLGTVVWNTFSPWPVKWWSNFFIFRFFLIAARICNQTRTVPKDDWIMISQIHFLKCN